MMGVADVKSSIKRKY